MVPGRPQQEVVVLVEDLPDRLPRRAAPFLVVSKRVKREFLETNLAGIGAGACGDLFAAIVGEHLLKGIGEELGAGAGAAAAKQVEGEEERAGFAGHSAFPCLRAAASLSLTQAGVLLGGDVSYNESSEKTPVCR